MTPADRVAALCTLDTRTLDGQTAAPGQTYAQSIGVRQAVGAWNTEATLSRVYAKNQFV